MAVRMDRKLRRELSLQLVESVSWTDSMAVLKNVNNEMKGYALSWPIVSEILKVSTASQWRHVSSHLNPADFASRGQKVDSFVQNQVWLSGPDFLTKSADSWPENPRSHERPHSIRS